MSKKHSRSTLYIVSIVTIAAFALCISTGWHSVIANESEEESPVKITTTRTAVFNSSEYSQNSGSDVTFDTGDSSVPVVLKIPSIGVEADIVDVGISKRGTMAVPNSYSNVGWYRYGPRPGQPGSAVIDGHVDNGLGLPAVFDRLDELVVGDTIEVTDTAGKIFRYNVVKKEIVPYATTLEEVFISTGIPKLNLITCSGDWNAEEKLYSDRLIVYTELVPTIR